MPVSCSVCGRKTEKIKLDANNNLVCSRHWPEDEDDDRETNVRTTKLQRVFPSSADAD